MAYTSSQIVQAVPTGINSALVLISSTTIGTTVSSVAISNAFSSTYDNYKIIVSGGISSASNAGFIYMGTGALPASGYYRFTFSGVYSGTTVTGFNSSNGAAWGGTFQTSTDSSHTSFELFSPNLAKNTHIISTCARSATTANALFTGGYLADTTQYTGFTLNSKRQRQLRRAKKLTNRLRIFDGFQCCILARMRSAI